MQAYLVIEARNSFFLVEAYSSTCALTALPIQRRAWSSSVDTQLDTSLPPRPCPCPSQSSLTKDFTHLLLLLEDPLFTRQQYTFFLWQRHHFELNRMDTIKGYLVPKQRKNNGNKKAVAIPPVELTVTPPGGSPLASPLSPSTKSPLSSRPASVYPAGDFRNGDSGNVLDIKTDVMVNWLHQQQMERLWSSEFPGEGVVLKKARDNFACSPASLRNESNGFYENIVAMNVRVSLVPFSTLILLISLNSAP